MKNVHRIECMFRTPAGVLEVMTFAISANASQDRLKVAAKQTREALEQVITAEPPMTIEGWRDYPVGQDEAEARVAELEAGINRMIAIYQDAADSFTALAKSMLPAIPTTYDRHCYESLIGAARQHESVARYLRLEAEITKVPPPACNNTAAR